MFLRETAGVGLLAAGAEENLGAEDVLVARPVELLERVAHLDLGLAIGVDLRRVEEVDTVVPSGLEALLDNITLLSAAVCEPTAEGKDGDLETGRAKVAEDLKMLSAGFLDPMVCLKHTMSFGSNELFTGPDIFAVLVD